MRCNTVGRDFEHTEVKVIDPETGEECPTGVQGEMCNRGYNTMKGYYKNPQATAEVIDKNGFLHSGDLGVKDEDGNYRITGRIKDMIIRGGENIYPREIEEFLYQLEGVKDVQVAGIPSKSTARRSARSSSSTKEQTCTSRMYATSALGKSPGTRFPNTYSS